MADSITDRPPGYPDADTLETMRRDSAPPDSEPTTVTDMEEIIRQRREESEQHSLAGMLGLFNRKALHELGVGA